MTHKKSEQIIYQCQIKVIMRILADLDQKRSMQREQHIQFQSFSCVELEQECCWLRPPLWKQKVLPFYWWKNASANTSALNYSVPKYEAIFCIKQCFFKLSTYLPYVSRKIAKARKPVGKDNSICVTLRGMECLFYTLN